MCSPDGAAALAPASETAGPPRPTFYAAGTVLPWRKMSQERFVARIRWQADADPTWEIETAHGGFETAEDAALFANGFLEAAADELRLDAGRLFLTLTDHSSIELSSEAVQIWRLRDDGTDCQVADDRDFERVLISIDRLSAMGFDGGFTQIKYGVANSAGAQVNVVLRLNEMGNLSVTVETALPGRADDASFAFGIIPRA
jgi:hypothetical protein